MVRIAFEVLLNPLQVFASMLGSFLVAMVMRVDILGVVGKGNRYSVERKKEVVVVDRLLVRTDLEEDEFWEEEDSEEELDYSDAVVWLKLEELRRKMTRERLEGVDVGGEKVEEGKKDEEEERERWRLLEEEEKRKEQVRKLAEKEASLLLEGDVVPPKNEKAIIRDLFMMLKRGGSDGGQKKSPLLRQEHSHKTVFNEVVRKFQLVEVRGKERHIEIHTFSNAVLELTNAIDALGGWLPVQSFIRTDIINNVRVSHTTNLQEGRLCTDDKSYKMWFLLATIVFCVGVGSLFLMQKVNRGCQKANTETLQEMVYTELDQNVDFYESGREALLWLKR